MKRSEEVLCDIGVVMFDVLIRGLEVKITLTQEIYLLILEVDRVISMWV